MWFFIQSLKSSATDHADGLPTRRELYISTRRQMEPLIDSSLEPRCRLGVGGQTQNWGKGSHYPPYFSRLCVSKSLEPVSERWRAFSETLRPDAEYHVGCEVVRKKACEIWLEQVVQ
jgi:hypothetical protein